MLHSKLKLKRHFFHEVTAGGWRIVLSRSVTPAARAQASVTRMNSQTLEMWSCGVDGDPGGGAGVMMCSAVAPFCCDVQSGWDRGGWGGLPASLTKWPLMEVGEAAFSSVS